MSIVRELLLQVETAIAALITGAEEMQISGRRYRKTDMEKLRVMRKSLQEELFYEQFAAGGTTRAYAAWPLRKGGIPPWD
ncbi:hypothetical protein EV210_106118 [Anaerospora hongkongensis]|uniref:Uncharacterized protein n=1 Tax=Anaerospora hongkongensis TaxID=244830 RepID=A0A4R1PXA3_9FIRM|nr:hypothetical protein [Anaerospora hongkongensis]TCL37249.1 hypothetical protein EV210_106118 [Anaerospora hongkongensis]